jgi:peptidoglycan/LPS O-acetylase OafA/YrhL
MGAGAANVKTPRAADAPHRTALDGLRALAIVGVMFVHAGVPGFKSGWIGVDLFFVLSGFLITTLLAMESSATGSIAYVPFMVRRALRLMPAYFLYATFITLLIWCWPDSVRSENGGWNAAGLTAAIWGYAINFVPQGGVWNGQDLTVHLWSLAVEQQYYLVWPVVFLALHRRPNVLRWVAVALAVVTTASFVAAPDGLYKIAMLFTRGFSLVVASALALWVFHQPRLISHAAFNRLVDGLGVLLLVALAVFPYKPGWSESLTRSVFIPFLVPIFAFWIARLWVVHSDGVRAPVPATTRPGLHRQDLVRRLPVPRGRPGGRLGPDEAGHEQLAAERRLRRAAGDLRGGQLRAGRSQLRVLREEIPSAGRSLQARSRRCRRRGIALSVTPVGPQATARSRTDVSSFATK